MSKNTTTTPKPKAGKAGALQGPEKGGRGNAKAPDKPAPKIDIGLDRALKPDTGTGVKVTPPASAAGKQAGGADRKTDPGQKPKKPVVKPKPPSKSDKMFKFLCNACGKKLEAQEGMAGESIQCPCCGNDIVVPEPADEPQTPKQRDQGVRYVLPEAFKFCCVRCGQSLEAARKLVGRRLNCPHCRSSIVVPEAPDM